MKQNLYKLGDEVFFINDFKISKGKVSGYLAEFKTEYSEWMKDFIYDYFNPHKIIKLEINAPDEVKVNGENIWIEENFVSKDEDKLKKINKMLIEERIKRVEEFKEKYSQRLSSLRELLKTT